MSSTVAGTTSDQGPTFDDTELAEADEPSTADGGGDDRGAVT
jgi:hypothetical protein